MVHGPGPKRWSMDRVQRGGPWTWGPCFYTSDVRCKQIPFPNPLQTWLVKIRRDASKDFKLTKRTKICSLHFKDLDFRVTLKGRRYIKDDALPSIFPWSVSSPNRKSPREKGKISLRCPLLVRRWIVSRPMKTIATRMIVRTKKSPI